MTESELKSRMERALAYAGPTHRIEDMARLIKDGKAQWWHQGDGAIITEVLNFPLLKAVNYWLIFGELHDCLALDERISRWAIGEGCEVAIATGRRGWGRAGAPYGWRQHAYTFAKRLTRDVWHRGDG